MRALLPTMLLLGCASADVASSAAPVVGGVFDQSAGPTVGIFRCTGTCAFTPFLDVEEICSGTLIGPNLVLTARHCVAPQIDADTGVLCSKSTFGTPVPAGNLIVTPAKDVFAGGPWYIASAIDVAGKDGDQVCGNDLAVLVLRQSYVGASPMVPRLTKAPVTLEKYSAIGYGDDLDGGLGFRHRRDGLTLGCVGSACPQVGPDLAPVVADAEFEGDTGLCGGDSGGPAVDIAGLLLGVTSRANGASCTFPIYSRVDAHAAWLVAEAQKAAALGDYAVPAWAFSAPQDAGNDAPSPGPDASAPAFDAAANDAASENPAEAVGGCALVPARHSSIPRAREAITLALALLLLRLRRTSAKSRT